MYLVFDVGGTFIKYAIMTITGERLVRGKLPTPGFTGTTVQSVDGFIDILGGVYDQYKQQSTIEGIAVSLPGQIDVEQGIVYGGGFLTYLDRVPLAARLSDRCDALQVALENDAKCATLAEGWIGNAKDAGSAFVMVFGTGVGGGFLMDGRLNRGQDMCAGELSYLYDGMQREKLSNIRPIEELHTQEEFDALPCDSWNDKVSMWPMRVRVAREKQMAVEDVSGELIYEWAAKGDAFATEILEQQYLNIARQICNIYALLAPEIILIGGGISAEPRFYEGIMRYVRQLKNLSNIFRNLKVGLCKYGNDSNLIGALYHYLQQFQDL